MFKLKNHEDTERLVEALNGLKDGIDVVRHLEVGVDFKRSERSYDVVLTTHFEDEAALEIYAEHAAHQPVLALARELCADTRVVDYRSA